MQTLNFRSPSSVRQYSVPDVGRRFLGGETLGLPEHHAARQVLALETKFGEFGVGLARQRLVALSLAHAFLDGADQSGEKSAPARPAAGRQLKGKRVH